jgi:phage FluMu gp28-like protein
MEPDRQPAATVPVVDRPTREEWIQIRKTMGRVTAANWRDTTVLLRYQSAIAQGLERHDVLVVEKSRRTGATWGAAAYATLTSASPRGNGGMDTLYVGTSYDMAKEFVDAAAMWARLYEKACSAISETIFDDGSDDGIKALRIDFASGFSVVALSSKPRSLRGRQGFVILDEAAFADSLDELLKAALALLMWGGKVLIISTHNGADNTFNQIITDIRAGRLTYGLIRFDLDDALKDGLFERICLLNPRKHGEWTPETEADWREALIADYRDAADEELYCIPSQGSGVFLPGPLIEARMHEAPVLRLSVAAGFFTLPEHQKRAEIAAWIQDTLDPVIEATLDKSLPSGFGMDVGRYRDLSSLCPMQVMRTMRRVVPFMVELERVPFAQQRQIAAQIIKRLPRRMGARIDATGIGAGIAEDLQTEVGAEPIKITVQWYREALPPLKASFEDDMILIPRDMEILADLRAFKVIRGVPALPALRKGTASGGTRHGDAGIAIALAYGATRSGAEAYDYQSGRRTDDDHGRWHRAPAEQALGGRSDGLW